MIPKKVLDKIMQEVLCEGCYGCEKASVEEIRKAIDAPQLEGLEHGDVLVAIPDKDGEFFYKGDDTPVVFDRYLTEAEKVAYLLSGSPSGNKIDADIIVAEDINRGMPVRFVVDSRVYQKA